MALEKQMEAAALLRGVVGGFEFAAFTELDEQVPQLELLNCAEKPTAAVASTAAFLGEGVVAGMPGKADHVAGQVDGQVQIADIPGGSGHADERGHIHELVSATFGTPMSFLQVPKPLGSP